MRRPRRLRLGILIAVPLAAVALILGAGVALGGRGASAPVESAAGDGPAPVPSDLLAASIASLQQQLRSDATNAIAWGTLALDYVQQAKNTVNPAYYPKAAAAVDRSLALNSTTNYVGMAGAAALNAAEHKFAAAESWAERGIKANPYNPTLYGTLADAQTQLGKYDEAAASVQKMVDMQPGVPAFTRAEYVFELRGDLSGARSAMQRALEDSSSAADRGFAYYYLGELAFNSGDASGALQQANAGLQVDPGNAALLEGRARAEAALGQTSRALQDYATAVERVPQPQYVVEYGELLQSLGRTREANEQYQLFETENELFTANGVKLDTDPALFYADHGQPAKALAYGESGIRSRPFIEMQDAYAWALHRNGRDTEALALETKVAGVGMRNALFDYHRGMIQFSMGQTANARASLRAALALNPHFSPLQAPVAQQTLTALEKSSS